MELFKNLFPTGEMYTLRHGETLFRVDGVAPEAMTQAAESLEKDGWHCQWRRQEGDSAFAAFRGGEQMCTLSYAPMDGTFRGLTEPWQDLPLTPEAPGPWPTLLTQVRLRYYAFDCGMCYVIRLSDGRFLILDGGMGEPGEAEHLLALLEAQNPLPGKPVIAGWFVTHPHDDHYDGFLKLMGAYEDRVKLERVLYNFPVDDQARGLSPDVPDMEALAASLPGAKVLTPRTGQRLCFADTVLEVLFTGDDLCPRFAGNVNNTSLVMRMTVHGRRILWLGDAMGLASDYLCRRYPQESLACELLQVGHHGYSGGSPELHRMADPEVLLWPCPDFWYHDCRRYAYNEFLLLSPKIRCVFQGGREEVTLDLTGPIHPTDPYAGYRKLRSGETLYREDFSGGVADLHWCCITGGSTGYGALELETEAGECRLKAGERWCVCELVQPGMMADTPGFTLKLSGSATTAGETVGLFYNLEAPWNMEPERILRLDPGSGAFSFTLTADPRAGKAVLTGGGETVEVPYIPEGRRGIYLVMRRAEITLHHIEVTKL